MIRKTISECLGRLYKIGKRGIAALAPIVFSAYDKGDPTAAQILRTNASSIAEILRAGAKRLDYSKKNRAVMIGGLTRRWDIMKPLLEEALGDDLDRVELVVYDGNVVRGALILAGMTSKCIGKI